MSRPTSSSLVASAMAPGTEAGPVASSALLRSGHLEESIVDPAKTLIEMISAARSYELNASMISIQDQTLGRLVNDLPKMT